MRLLPILVALLALPAAADTLLYSGDDDQAPIVVAVKPGWVRIVNRQTSGSRVVFAEAPAALPDAQPLDQGCMGQVLVGGDRLWISGPGRAYYDVSVWQATVPAQMPACSRMGTANKPDSWILPADGSLQVVGGASLGQIDMWIAGGKHNSVDCYFGTHPVTVDGSHAAAGKMARSPYRDGNAAELLPGVERHLPRINNATLFAWCDAYDPAEKGPQLAIIRKREFGIDWTQGLWNVDPAQKTVN